MKQKDIAVIIVIVFVSGVASFFISNKLFVTPSNRQQQVEVVDPINASFQQPDKKYFNSSSIDPTQSSKLGTGSNQNPFNGTN
jgi:hypothetical protein